MKNGITEMVFILDKSGSMSGLEADTIGGFNSMLARQRKAEGKALVTTIMFSNTSQVVHDRLPLESVGDLTDRDYIPGGCTALLDAMGGAITHIEEVHRYIRPEDVPEHTVFVITTDGLENASRKYRDTDVKRLVEKHREEGWEFLFLGANMDAITTARRYGIGADRSATFVNDAAGSAINYECVAQAVSEVRKGKKLSGAWKKAIEEDFANRG